MTRKLKAVVLIFALVALFAACQARQDVEDDQARGNAAPAAISGVLSALAAYPGGVAAG